MTIPGSAPTPATAGRPSPAWWGYLALLCLFAVGGMASYAVQIHRIAEMPPAALAVAILATLLNLAGILGLVLYILQRPFIGRAFWQAVFGLTVLQLLFSASQFARVLTMPGGGTESVVAVVGLTTLVAAVPLLYVLFTYAFRSPHLWRA